DLQNVAPSCLAVGEFDLSKLVVCDVFHSLYKHQRACHFLDRSVFPGHLIFHPSLPDPHVPRPVLLPPAHRLHGSCLSLYICIVRYFHGLSGLPDLQYRRLFPERPCTGRNRRSRGASSDTVFPEAYRYRSRGKNSDEGSPLLWISRPPVSAGQGRTARPYPPVGRSPAAPPLPEEASSGGCGSSSSPHGHSR